MKPSDSTSILRLMSFAFAFGNIYICAANAQDIDLEFHFLKVGLSRKAVVGMLGEPSAEAKSQAFFVRHRQLTWLDPEGRKYTAAFISDRLYHWKACRGEIDKC